MANTDKAAIRALRWVVSSAEVDLFLFINEINAIIGITTRQVLLPL